MVVTWVLSSESIQGLLVICIAFLRKWRRTTLSLNTPAENLPSRKSMNSSASRNVLSSSTKSSTKVLKKLLLANQHPKKLTKRARTMMTTRMIKIQAKKMMARAKKTMTKRMIAQARKTIKNLTMTRAKKVITSLMTKSLKTKSLMTTRTMTVQARKVVKNLTMTRANKVITSLTTKSLMKKSLMSNSLMKKSLMSKSLMKKSLMTNSLINIIQKLRRLLLRLNKKLIQMPL